MDISWLEQTEADVPTGNQWLSPSESTCLSGMRFAKRRTDWRLGRWTAKHAVAGRLRLSTDIRSLAEIEVLAASSGAPEIFLQGRPAESAISLSHRDGTALCTVARAGANIGCDLETIECRSAAFVADYFTVSEKALVSRSPTEYQPLLVSLVWSAKESALKALRQGLRLDTRCVRVRLADELLQSHRNAGLEPLASNPDGWRPLSVQCSSGLVYSGWWRRQDCFVRTVVSDLPLQVPARTRQESSLTENCSPR